ncbi:MAG: substrate-binding domain-containing protein [Victivallales bacterium]
MNKIERVSMEICAGIASGKFPPGGKLPTFDEMERIHNVSYITINACIKKLNNTGFVISRERSGVFVTEKPPLPDSFALLFPKNALAGNLFLQTLLKTIEGESEKKKFNFDIFPDFEPHIDNPDYKRLISDLFKMRIGGIAYFTMDPLPDECELLHFPGIPVMNASRCIKSDYKAYVDKSCDYLLSRKKRRIAVLFQGKSTTIDKMIGNFIEKKGNSEMESPDHWFIPIGKDAREGTENIVRFMLDCPKGKRPNGLIITDDNLVDHALKGVFLSRVQVPEDLEIVTHCNWPNPVTSVIPVKRIGYDVRKVVSIIIDRLLNSRGKGGNQNPEPIPLVPLFEEELQ